MALQVTSHTFASLHQEWERLLPLCAADTIFLTPYWQRLWWETFGAGQSLLLLALHQSAEPLGIAPLMRHNGGLSFLGETDLFDYHDFVVPHGQEKAFYPALVEYLASEEWERLHLASLPEASPTLTYLPELAQARGWNCQVEQEDVAPGLPLPSDWEGYLQGLSKKDRHELRRKHRRLEGTGTARHSVCSSPEAVRAALEPFFTLMGQSREEKQRFLTPPRREFFQAVVQELAPRGMLQLYFMEVGGEEAAAALCFDYHGQRLLYNSGFNPQHASLSVGLLLKALSLKDAIHGGMRYFDFLRGDEPYKYHLGGRDRRVYRLVISK
jgi:CelD/BcsL family acetyltransferase involved in cellulose biosynthesis